MNSNDITVPEKQRALILQGGGALGAYQVGVLKILVQYLMEKGNHNKDESLFDIIAGTSIGAMNGAVLVSNLVNKNKTWDEAIKELENFWTDGLSSTPDFGKWWHNDEDDVNKVYASEEALRKYYSVKEYVTHGTPQVCSAPFILKLDTKFGDQKDNLWYHHTNKPLENTIIRYSFNQDSEEKRIVTSLEKQQPRLLVISVDVADGEIVTFDSYHKEAEEPNNTIYNCDGITIDHIMASGTIPEFYDFRIIGGRQYCDGGWLSNTPFRELLLAHQKYWLRIIDKHKQKVPDLEIYIINNHPSKGPVIEDYDHDAVKDRTNDIQFQDRNSRYDENIANMNTDFFAIIDETIQLAKTYIDEDKFEHFKNDFDNFLKSTAKSRSAGEERMYKDIIDGRFALTKVKRIENTNYTDSIYGKVSDFTLASITGLIATGQADALKALNT
jgi:predicted acylesterase/phospholipase RssA